MRFCPSLGALLSFLLLATGPAVVAAGESETSADITPPRKVSGAEPAYPEEAIRKRLEGDVVLQATIDETGVVRDVRVVEEPGLGLGEAARKAVERWRFEPARDEDGDAVAIRYEQTLEFRLPDATAPADGQSKSVTSERAEASTERISLSLRDADLREVLRTFARIGDFNLVLDPNVQGKVTVELDDVPWDAALEQILKANGLWYEIDGDVLAVESR